MQRAKRSWFKIPSKIRKPLVFVIGVVFIIAAGLTGWLPGPGGIPLFLIGIAILATEFEWAEKFRDRIVNVIRAIGQWYRKNVVVGTLLFATSFVCFALLLYFFYRNILS